MEEKTSPKKPVLLEFLSFVVRPAKTISEFPEKKSPKKLKKKGSTVIWEKIKSFLSHFFDVIRLWSLQYVLAISAGILSLILTNKLQVDTGEHAVNTLLTEASALFILFFSVIYAPITEELSFRGVLRPNLGIIGFSLPFTILVALQFIINFFPTLEGVIPSFLYNPFIWQGALFYLAFIIIATTTGVLLDRKLMLGKKISAFYIKNIWWMYYLSAVIFGVLHITNFIAYKEILFFMPLLIAPQLIVGFFLGFIRIRYNLNWSILAHMLHNLISVAPILLLISFVDGYATLMQNPELNPSEIMSFKDMAIVLFVFAIAIIVFLFLLILIAQMIAEVVIYLVKVNSLKVNERGKS
ncbi:CPBP family intramembrane metalloprotease [Candidatus Dojkabacteria bacterium]|nr:CPBP family intramembrane metalloprotease [Candidatus Dojkabacteria bacterium]